MSESHSKYSASNFEANMLCPGREVMSAGIEDRGSKYADEGTAAHAVLELALQNGRPAMAYCGRRIAMKDGGAPRTVDVTEEMCEPVQTALDGIARIAAGGMVISETRVNYSRALGVDPHEGWGTSDVIAAVDVELQVHDYKHGRGVEVFAEENPQMMLYALGALEQAQRILGDFDRVRMVIHQPRIKDAPSEWVCTTEELYAWAVSTARPAVTARIQAEQLHPQFEDSSSLTQAEWERRFLRPNEKSCKFCRAKSTCPALREDTTRTVFEIVPAAPEEFEQLAPAQDVKFADSDWLARVMSKADMIEDYLKAVRAEVESRLLQAQPVPGYKIVEGKRGNRAWSDAGAAEVVLREMVGTSVSAAYKPRELITPAAAQTLLGKAQYDRRLAAYVTQSDGRKHVAPVSDPRPALALMSAADDFTDISADFA
jgi:hypothetical protein